jgi:hypothetical protein
MILLENKHVRLEIGEADGVIRRLADRRLGIDYIADVEETEPFRLELTDGAEGGFDSCEWEAEEAPDGGGTVRLAWRTAHGMTVNAVISLGADDSELTFRCSAENGAADRLLSLEYPILSGLREVTEGGEDDYVAHSFATGVKVRNPMRQFAEAGDGLRYMPYPECFSGASMQFFAYYGLNKGGLYFAAADGEGHPKWLNFYKGSGGLLEASFIHGCENIGPGRGIEPPYPVRIRLLEGRDWYEAADLYKPWAVRQKWCSRGQLADRSGTEADWLRQEMAVATFGINAGADRTPWLRAYHEHIGTPMFHVLGPDWTHAPQTFGSGVPGGFDDWFPTRFNPENLACMKELGHRYAPFEFDYLYNLGGADGEKGRQASQKFPERKKSIDAYKFSLLCPAHPYTHEFHVRRDAELQRRVDVDAIYYDISANNILKVCMDESHGHPIGAGKVIEDAYRRNFEDTKAAMQDTAGRFVPMGTEMINETMIGVIDYYQARAGGQPAAPLELWPLRHLLKSGDAELIPMFHYVYHEYGPLRMDGWGKLVEEIGTLYYYTLARTYLWGGLYELNYEYSPMEAIDGLENGPAEHYYAFEPRGYAFSPERAGYLAMYARLRVGAANKYWAYGRMLRPLTFENARIRAGWFHYNHGVESPEYNDAGELDVDAIVHSAWRYREESTALFFANIDDAPHRITIPSGPDAGIEGAETITGRLYTVGREDGEPLAIDRTPSGGLAFALPPRSMVMIELR